MTNSEEFLKGLDKKINIQEVGPYIFSERFTHTNISFNENGTLTYTSTRKPVFLPELNTLDLNDTIITPNMALLGMASYLWDASSFLKFMFKMSARNLGSKPFVNVRVQDYFFNFTDPLLVTGNKFIPFMVPTKNMGILERVSFDLV